MEMVLLIGGLLDSMLGEKGLQSFAICNPKNCLNLAKAVVK